MACNITYGSEVRDMTFLIFWTIAAWNILEVKTVDILNTYSQKDLHMCLECGIDVRNIAIIIHAIYGLKSV